MPGIQFTDPERYPHGTRARYVAGRCRCEPCRRANREYAKARARAELPNGLVDSAKAREHLIKLRAAGVGQRAVTEAGKVARSVLRAIMRGAKVRAESVRRVLSVDAGAASDGAYVSSADARSVIAELKSLGLSGAEIARRLGYVDRTGLMIHQRITVRRAWQLKKLLEEVKAESRRAEADEELPDVCARCGEAHDQVIRVAWVRRVLSAGVLTRAEMIAERPCWYDDGSPSGVRKLDRDIAASKKG